MRRETLPTSSTIHIEHASNLDLLGNKVDFKEFVIGGFRSVFCVSRFVACKQDPAWVLPCMDYIGMCRCEGYGFQAVYSRIGYINQNVWV